MSQYIEHTKFLHEQRYDGQEMSWPAGRPDLMGEGQIQGETKWSDFLFWCPGCKENHAYRVNAPGFDDRPRWVFDGNFESPTFSPSLLYPSKVPRCHLHLESGLIKFCGDCGHDLAGKTVTMEPIDICERART